MSEELNPITRTEMFLAKAAGQNTPELTPITRVERFLQNLINHIKSIGTGGGGATPDWNAAEGEVGYIKNRTHCFEGYEAIVENTTGTFVDGMCSLAPPSTTPPIGALCEVIYNGVKYSCTVFDLSSLAPTAIGIGNGAGFGLEDTGEPFTIGIIPNQMFQIMTLIEGTSNDTFTLEILAEKNKKIDIKYLPDEALNNVAVAYIRQDESANMVCSMTVYEMFNYSLNGTPIILSYRGQAYNLSDISDIRMVAEFTKLAIMDDRVYADCFTVTEDGSASRNQIRITT